MNEPTPQYTSPQYNYAPAPVVQMSGGAKAAWFFIGFFMGLIGLLIAYATSRDKPAKIASDSVKFTAIGFAVSFVVSILLGCALSMFFATITQTLINNLPYYM